MRTPNPGLPVAVLASCAIASLSQIGCDPSLDSDGAEPATAIVTLCGEKELQGTCTAITASAARATALPSTAASMLVGPGVAAYLCPSEGFQGECRIFAAGVHDDLVASGVTYPIQSVELVAAGADRGRALVCQGEQLTGLCRTLSASALPSWPLALQAEAWPVRVRSISLRSGYIATLCSQSFYGGSCAVMTGWGELPASVAENTNSLTLSASGEWSPAIDVCDLPDLAGSCASLSSTEFHLDGHMWPESNRAMAFSISSVRVRAGQEALLCADGSSWPSSSTRGQGEAEDCLRLANPGVNDKTFELAGTDMNQRAAMIAVYPSGTAPSAYVCKGANLVGPCDVLGSSRLVLEQWPDGTSMNDTIGSLLVKPGYDVLLRENAPPEIGLEVNPLWDGNPLRPKNVQA
jgi:hypothetical protein